ncbi:TetR/AcrR family transcriptional regulator [Pontixanthobacter aquaemixtae]|uniref:TetR family transcriptional regulator n=1 Tax=Pontixanthobacter aquaemixtae TaxID=1958940 RepID=A0A844ZSA1_9SPHN|nr:TetR/AcrR family transcriptional regulator [Pontixanthobacter aquaemixtae]MXO89876.1 TetR family transcriptional regulator [Pontixanthobacter aquaemixtae]
MEAPRGENDRRDQLLAAAESLILAQNSLAITLNDVADELGVSRSLIYVYFDNFPQIIDALFERRIREAGIFIVSPQYRDLAFSERTLALFDFYLEHLIEQGPLMLLVLRERNQDSPLGEMSKRHFRSMLRLLSRDIADNLELSARESFVLLELLASIPESLARLARSEELDAGTARATTRRLVKASIDALEVREAG